MTEVHPQPSKRLKLDSCEESPESSPKSSPKDVEAALSLVLLYEKNPPKEGEETGSEDDDEEEDDEDEDEDDEEEEDDEEDAEDAEVKEEPPKASLKRKRMPIKLVTSPDHSTPSSTASASFTSSSSSSSPSSSTAATTTTSSSSSTSSVTSIPSAASILSAASFSLPHSYTHPQQFPIFPVGPAMPAAAVMMSMGMLMPRGTTIFPPGLEASHSPSKPVIGSSDSAFTKVKGEAAKSSSSSSSGGGGNSSSGGFDVPQKVFGPTSKFRLENKSRLEMHNRCAVYVKANNVKLTDEYEQLESVVFNRRLGSRREHSMNLHRNHDHLTHVRHKPTGVQIYFCYVSRLVLVKRVSAILKKTLPEYTVNKLTGKSSQRAEFKVFADYLPPFLEDQCRKKTKANKETFSACFILLYKDPQNRTHVDHSLVLGKKEKEKEKEREREASSAHIESLH